MSAIGTLHIVPIELLPQLEAAILEDEFDENLETMETVSIDYGYSGWVLVTLLPVLSSSYGIDLMQAYPDLARKFSAMSEGALLFVLTYEEWLKFSERLDPNQFSSEALEQAYETFNATSAKGIGEIMLEGIRFLRAGLEQTTPEIAALLTIG